MSLTPWNRQEEWYQQIINASTGKYLPSVTAQDAGKVLAVGSDGGWVAQGYLELSGTFSNGEITVTTSPLPSREDVADAYNSGKGILLHFPSESYLLMPFGNRNDQTSNNYSYTFGGTGNEINGHAIRVSVELQYSGSGSSCFAGFEELNNLYVQLTPTSSDFSGTMSHTVADIAEALNKERDVFGIISIENQFDWLTPTMSAVIIEGYAYPRLEWWIVYDGKLGCLYVNETNDPDENTYSVTTYDITDKAISTTYETIKDMRDSGNLVKGATYRMTDFVTKINGTYDLSTVGASGYVHVAKSAEHPFDLLLYAIDESNLSEIAKATWHEGDSYFADAKVDAWDIRYCLDNDTTRFAWADATNGKGVIYWMRDEWGNEAWVDFKNLLNVRYALSASDPNLDTGLAYDASEQPNRYGSPQHLFEALQGYMGSGSYDSPFPYPYDFAVGANILGTVQMPALDETYLSTFAADLYYTFDYYDGTNHADASLNANAKIPCRNNKIDATFDPLIGIMTGNQTVLGLGCNCWETNAVYVAALSGTDTDNIQNNEIGNGCCFNTFGNTCSNNVLGSYSYSNSFGSSCYRNSFGSSCSDNSFGIKSTNNELAGYIRNCEFGTMVRFVELTAAQLDEQHYGTSYHIMDNVQGTDENNKLTVTVNTYAYGANAPETYVGYNSSGTLKTWCPADLAQ